MGEGAPGGLYPSRREITEWSLPREPRHLACAPLGLGSNDRLALPTQKRWPYQVMTFVEWCAHQLEVILVPEGDGWYSHWGRARWTREADYEWSPDALAGRELAA